MGVPPGTPGAAADDIVTPPGGCTYRANVHQEGQPDWPAILQSETSLVSSSQTLSITYRSYIETRAGETRNNIFYLKASGTPPLDPLTVNYEAVDLPGGVTMERDRQMYGGIGGQDKTSSRVLLKVHVASDVKSGEYPFAIQMSFGGTNFGSVPCVLKVL
jgi:hypothetical protein